MPAIVSDEEYEAIQRKREERSQDRMAVGDSQPTITLVNAPMVLHVPKGFDKPNQTVAMKSRLINKFEDFYQTVREDKENHYFLYGVDAFPVFGHESEAPKIGMKVRYGTLPKADY